MKIAHYIGTHVNDDLSVRAGWAITRLVQRGEFKRVTHVEAILMERADGTVMIASASLRDGGVRMKQGVRLDPASWLISDVVQWESARAAAWFHDHDGAEYDVRGALATVLPGRNDPRKFFCNEAVGAAAGLKSSQIFGPAQFAAICFSLGRDVTPDFFAARQ